MQKVMGITFNKGVMPDGKAWENYHLFIATDIYNVNNCKVLKGAKYEDIKVSKNVIDNLGFAIEELYQKDIELIYNRYGQISGISIMK